VLRISKTEISAFIRRKIIWGGLAIGIWEDNPNRPFPMTVQVYIFDEGREVRCYIFDLNGNKGVNCAMSIRCQGTGA